MSSIDHLAILSPFSTTDSPNLLNAFQGDSGSPIWQYVNGRAVVIGVMSSGSQTGGCGKIPEMKVTATRVSSYIDWIMSVTGLDTWHLKQTGHTDKYRDVDGELNRVKIIILKRDNYTIIEGHVPSLEV